MNQRIEIGELETHESVSDALDLWMAGDPTREVKVRKTILGNTCVLSERGASVGVGRGAGCIDAIANALMELK